MYTETQYRQKQLDKHVNKYYEELYDDYIYADCGGLIIFFKYLKTQRRLKSRTINITGLICPLVNI